MRNFLGEYKAGSKTSHLINWKLVHSTNNKGGLGFLNLGESGSISKMVLEVWRRGNHLWRKNYYREIWLQLFSMGSW